MSLLDLNRKSRALDRGVLRIVVATGVASVVTQLLTIREVLAGFQGNEIVIALVLFCWLILGGLGTLLAQLANRRVWKASLMRLVGFTFALAALAPIQLILLRSLRDVFFVHGSSVGFYPTFVFTLLTIAPYGLLLGFVLPYSLYVLRGFWPEYPGTRIYIFDNIGDVAGGALFSFVLVFLVTPLWALLLAHLALVTITFFAVPPARRLRFGIMVPAACALTCLIAAVLLEAATLAPREGRLAFYRDSRYGRITVHADGGQYTLFTDGVPLFSNQNRTLAEETVHYPLSQVPEARRLLLISAQAGMTGEVAKYHPEAVDYVELDPALTQVQFRFGMLRRHAWLRVIHRDARAFLRDSEQTYDAVIVNLPEPDTLQINRFYTARFFETVQARLAPGGVYSFTMEGFDNYLAEAQRRKLSSLYRTARLFFDHVLLLPGQRIFFVCSDQPIDTDIPALLQRRGIATEYVSRYFYGNLSQRRIRNLNELMDPEAPINRDTAPYLLRVMFRQWFAKFDTSPRPFIAVLCLFALVYLFCISREEFVLFTTGCMTMGSEVLIIFAFQLYFGYVYFKIGVIVTVFLAGLLPGAWLGERLRRRGKAVLAGADALLILLLALFATAVLVSGDRLPTVFFLACGLAIALACGFQFPVALYLRGSDNPAVARTFSADLIGAAFGTLFTSTVLVPYAGIVGASAGLAAMKLASLIVVGATHARA